MARWEPGARERMVLAAVDLFTEQGYDATTVAQIAEQLSVRRIGSVLVMEDTEKVAGVVSERDLVRAMAAHGLAAFELEARQVMTRDVVTCHPDDSIEHIMEMMTNGRFRHLPVVDRGELTEAEANNHPHSNILVGCLGTESDPPITTHVIPQLQPGDVLLACSDGVWHYFSPTELASVVDSLSPREATEFLIEKARSRARGGGDNLSLVVVKIEALAEEKKIARLTPLDMGRP